MKIPTIIGPTAVGKTTVAVSVASQIQGEIISADSRQIYQHMHIGTAQPDVIQQQRTRFHLIGFVEPGAQYSCGQFARDAETAINDILQREHIPIVCGGTGLYVQALYDPLHTLPESDPALKRTLTRMIKEQGIASLYARLQRIDPAWAQKIGPRDQQRIIRGLEVFELTGTPLSILTEKKKRRPCYAPLYIGLQLPRAELYARIEERFDKMMEQGFLEETRVLLQKDCDPACNALRTIGYREMIDHLQGKTTLLQAITKAKQHTRQFAKRQPTWFRKLSTVQWFDPRDKGLVAHLAALFKAAINE